MSVKKLAAAPALLCFALSVFAQDEAVSPPVGGMTVTIAAGTGTTRTVTVFSAPLWMESSISGATVGRIASVTASTITVTGANWTAGALSNAAIPHFIQITSGSAAGRALLVSSSSANTADTLTIDSTEAVDLTTLGISTGSNGDTFKIFAADTLSLLLPGNSGVLGGATAAVSDQVMLLVGGTWRSYFYSTTNNRWTQNTFGSPNAANVPVGPHGAVMYSRLGATPITLTFTGGVPAMERKLRVPNSGVSFLSTGWPVNTTLQTSGIQSIPGWRASASPSNADIVQMMVSGTWRRYFYDGSNWRQVTFGSPLANSQTLVAGAGFILDRAAGAGSNTLTQSAPYTL